MKNKELSIVFRSANGAALAAAIGGIVKEIASTYLESKDNSSFIDFVQKHQQMLLLALFIVVYKVKSTLDDHKHFGEDKQDEIKSFPQHFGFLFGIFTWIFQR